MYWVLLTNRDFYFYMLVWIAWTAALCLVALWVGLGRRYWLLRAAALCGAILLHLPVRAYEPALLFLVVLPPVVMGVNWLSQTRVRLDQQLNGTADSKLGTRLRFRLPHLFVFTLFMATTVMVGVSVWRNVHLSLQLGVPLTFNWLEAIFMLVTALCMVVLSLLAVVVIQPGRRRKAWAAALLGVVITTAAIHTWVAGDWLGFKNLLTYLPYWYETFCCLLIGTGAFVTIVLVGLWLPRIALCPASPDSSRRIVAKGALVLCSVAMLVPMGWIYAHMLHTPQPPPEPDSQVNRYPQIVAAAEAARQLNPQELTIRDLAAISPRSAQQLKATYAKLFDLVQEPSHVSIDYSEPNYLLPPGRGLARAWSKEIRLAQEEGRWQDAVTYGIGGIRLGHALSKGGDYARAMVGWAIQLIAIESLTRERKELPPFLLQEMLPELDRLEQARDSLELVIARGRVLDDNMMHWQARFHSALPRLKYPNASSGAEVYDKFIRARDIRFRLLKTDVAIRLFHIEHGRLPEQLSELVPDYLPQVPSDTYSAGTLFYRRHGEEFVLYSAGTNGRDDGGRFGTYVDLNRMEFHNDVDFDLDLDVAKRSEQER